MKIACERCNKIMDNKIDSLKYKVFSHNSDDFILCKDCHDKFLNWLDNKESERRVKGNEK